MRDLISTHVAEMVHALQDLGDEMEDNILSIRR